MKRTESTLLKCMAIARKVGWKEVYRSTRNGNKTPDGVTAFGIGPTDSHHGGCQTYSEVPNYFEDHTAMYNAIAKLNHTELQDYIVELGMIYYQGAEVVEHLVSGAICLTAECKHKANTYYELFGQN